MPHPSRPWWSYSLSELCLLAVMAFALGFAIAVLAPESKPKNNSHRAPKAVDMLRDSG